MRVALLVLIILGAGFWFWTQKVKDSWGAKKMKLPYPELLIDKSQQADVNVGPWNEFKEADMISLTPAQVLSSLEQVADSNLTFTRFYPEGNSILAHAIALPHVSCLRSAIKQGEKAVKAYIDEGQPDKAVEVLTAMMKITSGFRKKPSCLVEMLVGAVMDRMTLGVLTEAKDMGIIEEASCFELIKQYRPTRSEYATALKSALNGEVFMADGIMNVVLMSQIPADVLKEDGSADEREFWQKRDKAYSTNAELHEQVSKVLGALPSLKKAYQDNRAIAKDIVKSFSSGRYTQKEIDKISLKYARTKEPVTNLQDVKPGAKGVSMSYVLWWAACVKAPLKLEEILEGYDTLEGIENFGEFEDEW